MAILSNETRAHAAGVWAVRCFLSLAAVAAIGWGAFCLPIFWQQVQLDSAKDALLRNIPLSNAELAPLQPLLDQSAARTYCVPSIERSAAVVRLRLAENAFSAGGAGSLDARLAEADAAAVRSLRCLPSDPYLWLVLFWLRNNRVGLSPQNFDLLRMSYRLGPNEAWVISKRSHIALAMYDALPPDLARDAIEEFSRLVKSELYSEAIEVLRGPGWSHRDQLLAHVAPERKAVLARVMADLGYDIERPGQMQSLPR